MCPVAAGDGQLALVELEPQPPRRHVGSVHVGEGVHADFVALGVHPPNQVRASRGPRSDHEEGGRHLVGLQDVQDLLGPPGWPVVEGEDDVSVWHAQACLPWTGRVHDRAPASDHGRNRFPAIPGMGGVGALADLTVDQAGDQQRRNEDDQGESEQDPMNGRRPTVRATADGCALHEVVGSTPASGDGAVARLALAVALGPGMAGGVGGGALSVRVLAQDRRRWGCAAWLSGGALGVGELCTLGVVEGVVAGVVVVAVGLG